MATMETRFHCIGMELRKYLLEIHRHSFTARKPSIN